MCVLKEITANSLLMEKHSTLSSRGLAWLFHHQVQLPQKANKDKKCDQSPFHNTYNNSQVLILPFFRNDVHLWNNTLTFDLTFYFFAIYVCGKNSEISQFFNM